jgi:hypothetical protein
MAGNRGSDRAKIVETGEIIDNTVGSTPSGHIIYGQDGRMSALIVREPHPKPDSLATMNDQERADLFRSMIAYGGPINSTAQRLSTTSTFPGMSFGRARFRSGTIPWTCLSATVSACGG